MEATVVEAQSAEWIAIISECMESGALGRLPPPIASNGVNVTTHCWTAVFESCISLFFSFSLPRAALSSE